MVGDIVLLPDLQHNDPAGLQDAVAALARHDITAAYLRRASERNVGGKRVVVVGPCHLAGSSRADSGSLGRTASSAVTGPTTPGRTASTSTAGSPRQSPRPVARDLKIPRPKGSFVKNKPVLIGFYREHRARGRLRSQAIVEWIDKHGHLCIRPARYNCWAEPLSVQNRSLMLVGGLKLLAWQSQSNPNVEALVKAALGRVTVGRWLIEEDLI
ncbi:hypothetical protein DL765_008329 [Monosporascus sp. GIB2]|nr:hypothetical protein DL765_008329 [Monosporascus sp. GIB2]